MHCKSFDCVSEWKSIERRRRRIAHHDARVLLLMLVTFSFPMEKTKGKFWIWCRVFMADTQQVEHVENIKDVAMATSFISHNNNRTCGRQCDHRPRLETTTTRSFVDSWINDLKLIFFFVFWCGRYIQIQIQLPTHRSSRMKSVHRV